MDQIEAIVREVLSRLQSESGAAGGQLIPAEMSARHVHLTQEQIDRSMEERGLVLPGRGGGLFYETPSRQVLVTDIDENNCVLTPGGRVVAFDCEAMVNDIEGFGGRFHAMSNHATATTGRKKSDAGRMNNSSTSTTVATTA